MKRNVCIILILLLLLGSLSACGRAWPKAGSKDPDPEPPVATEPAIETPQEHMLEFSEETIKHYGETSSNLWELLQRFFTDQIVYRDKLGNFCYEPVNTDLPLSDYDWENLVDVTPLSGGKELEYREDGVTTSLKGIDVSRYQETIDWEKVAADGVKFAIIRLGYRGYASEGKLVMDANFEENVVGALKAGVAVGVYFVTQAISEAEAVEEAQFVAEAIRPYNITWPVVLDIEATSSTTPRTKDVTQQERTDYTIAFCEEIKRLGYTPMLYANIRWYIEELDLTRLTAYDKWFAQYFNHPFFPYAFQMWQYTDSGKVDGIKGKADMNLAFKDYGAKE